MAGPPTSSAVIERFNAAVNRHDVEGMVSLMTSDCVFENTRPAPDGERFVGREAIGACFAAMFERSPQARFEIEESFAVGDRCVVRWIYRWIRDGKPGHVRGVDVFRLRDGLIAEKLSYVKG